MANRRKHPQTSWFLALNFKTKQENSSYGSCVTTGLAMLATGSGGNNDLFFLHAYPPPSTSLPPLQTSIPPNPSLISLLPTLSPFLKKVINK